MNNVDVELSIIKPNIQKRKRKGGGTKADTNHNPAEIEKPIEYRLTSGRRPAAAEFKNHRFFLNCEGKRSMLSSQLGILSWGWVIRKTMRSEEQVMSVL